ncbi:MAG: hypothetical protein H5T84_11425 [Thermoleophilia bacterium]|nr:hypothetical protein [Thermoleophilia bacterium]
MEIISAVFGINSALNAAFAPRIDYSLAVADAQLALRASPLPPPMPASATPALPAWLPWAIVGLATAGVTYLATRS